MAKILKFSSIFFLLFLCGSTLVSTVLSQDSQESLEPEESQESEGSQEWEGSQESNESEDNTGSEEETEVEVIDENAPRVLGDGPININIQPVTDGAISCEGRPDGVAFEINPVDCSYFYICIEGQGHKVHCPAIPGQTYFNPLKKTCADVSANFCKEIDIAELMEEEEEERKMHTEEETEMPKENISENRVEL